ncbi:MAG: EAL domain-containing protein [Granulosicoccus sp.]
MKHKADKKESIPNDEFDPEEQSRRLIANARIMMVDDEPINMDVLMVHLEGEGYTRFSTVSNSMLALEALRREQPDVLLLDLVMPVVTGYDILGEMRRDPMLKAIPVIILTSSNDAAAKLAVLKLGATDFLAKPVDASELALRMRNTLTARAWQKRVSHFDALTELPNRLFFTSVLQRRMDSQSRQKSALILINISRFKSINDSFGTDSGDQVLIEFRNRLVSEFGTGTNAVVETLFGDAYDDLSVTSVARLGGDRFAILLPLKDSASVFDQIRRRLERFLVMLDQPFEVDGQSVYLSISAGVSTLTDSSTSVDLLINEAETAMLHTRRRSDAPFAMYSPYMDASARESLSMENGLRTAVESNELYLLYQPKVDVASDTVAGAEALVRWQNPEFGLISPVNFIPLAEETGMIVSIGKWVMEESCRQAAEWRNSGHPDFQIAVNVSIRQLRELDFIRVVESALSASGLPAEALIIELTENMIMENAEDSIVKLRQLKQLGVKLSIDDFGTGYSSLSYLQRFPLDQLKIDRSFISEVRSADERVPIVKAVISLAHDLGLSVVAEGIETEQQLAHIRGFNCEQYQGYLFSKPVAVDVFTELMLHGRRKSA